MMATPLGEQQLRDRSRVTSSEFDFFLASNPHALLGNLAG